MTILFRNIVVIRAGSFWVSSLSENFPSFVAGSFWVSSLSESYRSFVAGSFWVSSLSESYRSFVVIRAESFGELSQFRRRIFRSLLTMEILEEENNYSDIVRRLVARTGMSEDKATVLLVRYKWDEAKFNYDFLRSYEYLSISTCFVDDPEHDVKRTLCRTCNEWENCRNIGCGHHLCWNCFRVDIEQKILHGDLELVCPYPRCGKYLSHQYIKQMISDEALALYHLSLMESLRISRPQVVEDTLCQKAMTFVLQLFMTIVTEIGEGLREALVEYIRDLFMFALRSQWQRLF
ncbi:unnamed protein product [Arabis nemorensis]|uniref:Uncharacterized protein n=1 Tax=Arabis nemorensis TaxID=586526 RepID=A0A565BAW8_9BRAS|nr:unnamed protein product [Arabis nemorensis]